MSKDISTPYTKYRNQNTNRKRYAFYKREKETVISPKNYGEFVLDRKRGRK